MNLVLMWMKSIFTGQVLYRQILRSFYRIALKWSSRNLYAMPNQMYLQRHVHFAEGRQVLPVFWGPDPIPVFTMEKALSKMYVQVDLYWAMRQVEPIWVNASYRILLRVYFPKI